MALRVIEGKIIPKFDGSDVAMFESRISRQPEYSTGLLTCIGLVAARRDIFVIGHFSSVAEAAEYDGPNVFSLALTGTRLIGADKFWLVGGGSHSDGKIGTVGNDREFAVEAVKSAMPLGGVLQVRWTETPKTVVDIYVDPRDSVPVTLFQSPAV